MKKEYRFTYLDSLRGLAAFAVVLSHLQLANADLAPVGHRDFMTAVSSISQFALYALPKLHEASRSAVMLFFVLSGFVLAFWLQTTPTPYGRYAIRRSFRIYTPYALVVVLSYGLHLYIGSDHLEHPEWLNGVINPKVSGGNLAKHLLLWGTKEAIELDNVSWSLVHEMRVSLLFPLILISVQRYTWRCVLLLLLFSIGCNMWALAVTGQVIVGYQQETLARTFLDTGYFIVFFALGAYLAVEGETAYRRIRKAATWMQVCLVAGIFYILLKSDLDHHSFSGSLVDYLRGAGAAGLIACAISMERMQVLLTNGVLLWLGRISYSLYLVHVPVIYVLKRYASGVRSLMAMDVAVVLCSLLLAELMVRLVEQPANELGKRLAGTLSGGRSQPAS
jgi:peptidoglycan/LPS O-acetylase OafA/YrhL